MIRTSQNQLISHLKNDLVIREDDVVFLFSSMRDLGLFEGGPTGIIETFKNVLKKGSLILPTFTYSWSRKMMFNKETTYAPEMGLISSASIGRRDFFRTNHPNFSVNICTSSNKFLHDILPTSSDSFGEGSVFFHLYTKYPATKILIFGGAFPDCNFRSTFIHTGQQVERAWHRYLKKFNDPMGLQPDVTQFVRFFSREEFISIYGYEPAKDINFPIQENFNSYSNEMLRRGILKLKKFGYGQSRLATVGDSIECFRECLRIDKNYGL